MSSEIANPEAPTVSGQPEGNTGARVMRARHRLCGVVDPMHAPKLQAQEPRDPVVIRNRKGTDRWEKAKSYKAHMYGGRESSSGIVLTKRSNAGQGGPKEIVEGRPLAKEKVRQSIPAPTPCRTSGPTHGWGGVRDEAYASEC